MELKGEDYRICYDAATQTVICQGALRLIELDEYNPMWELLTDVIALEVSPLILDLRDLVYLNSSGFNVISKFVLRVRQQGSIEMSIRLVKSIPWHERSFKNLQRLMPNLKLDLE